MSIIERIKNFISGAEVGAVATQNSADKACAWAKKIANDNSYHYVRYTSDKKTHECPVCHNHPKGKTHGWNCIGYAFATWRHGSGLKSTCNCSVMHNAAWEQTLKASDKEALSIVQKRVGLKSLKVIRNGGKAIPTKNLKKGDIIAYFKGNKYMHTALYIGDGKMSDCTSGRSDNIKYGVKLSSVWAVKVAIRYTGDKATPKPKPKPVKKHYTGTYPSLTVTKNGKTVVKPIKKGEKSTRVRHLELFLAWYGYNIIADGIYGDKTLAAVKKFQKAKGIKPTGTVGKKTIAAMKEATK